MRKTTQLRFNTRGELQDPNNPEWETFVDDDFMPLDEYPDEAEAMNTYLDRRQ